MMRLTLLILAFACHFCALAQKDVPGYLVNFRNDTVPGFINDRTDADLASGFVFTKTTGVQGHRYTADSIGSFGFNYGRLFRKFPVKARRSDKDSLFVFAKKIVDGRISLYTYSSKQKGQPDMFLVNNHTGDTAHLSPPTRTRKVNKDGRTVDVESNIYLGKIKILKGDTLPNQNSERIKYSEKEIRKNIQAYNAKYERQYPMSFYRQRSDSRYDVTAGIPIWRPGEDVDISFRISAYRRKYWPESSRRVSHIMGISYRYLHLDKEPEMSVRESWQNFKQQFISIIPLGFGFEADSGFIRPYCYAGIGLVLLIEDHYRVANNEYKGVIHEYYPFLTFNVGAGVKIKAGNDFILAEITPTAAGGGVFVNVGYSF